MITAQQLMWARIASGVLALLIVNQGVGIWRARRQSSQGAGWPSVEGEIIASGVEHVTGEPGTDDERRDVAVSYRYTVAGKEHRGTRIRWGARSSLTRDAAQALLARYPAGARVRVFHDPKRPEAAVLEPRDRGNAKAMTVFLIVFCLIELGLAPLAITGSNPTTSLGTPLFVFLMPLACFAVAIGGVISFVRTWRAATASRHWPSVEGVIAGSDISIVRERDDGDEDRQRRDILKYRPDIRYTYRIDGGGHSSAKVEWGWDKLYGARSDAEAVIAKYQVGQAVTVFYDPANPDTAVLRPRSRGGAVSSLVFAAIFGVGGAIFFWAFATLRFE